jgi:hypothetical protein
MIGYVLIISMNRNYANLNYFNPLPLNCTKSQNETDKSTSSINHYQMIDITIEPVHQADIQDYRLTGENLKLAYLSIISIPVNEVVYSQS